MELVVKAVLVMPVLETQESVFDPWVGKLLCSREWQPTPVFLPQKFHGQRSLAGYSPRGRKQLDRTEHMHPYIHLTDGGN